ncbi:MAG: serine/threonine-protein kinase [Pseudomonadota bacterium]
MVLNREMIETSADARQLGDYQLIRRLAIGGMAEIFEAKKAGALETVVIKILLPQFSADPDFIQMFEDEARLTVGLNHPNLVRVHDFCQADNFWFIVMEYVKGPTLAQLLACAKRDSRSPSVLLSLCICKHLLEALRYISSLTDVNNRPMDVVHRDVTPGNILVSHQGQIKLGDFGIAQHRFRKTRTRTGVIKGTVQYMAPEQISGSKIDHRTDLYGVGLILFELLTGRPFVFGEREVDLLRLAQKPKWIAPSSINKDLNPALDQLVRPALMQFPEQRYPDANAFLAAIQNTTELLFGKRPEPLAQLLKSWMSQLDMAGPLQHSTMEQGQSIDLHSTQQVSAPFRRTMSKKNGRKFVRIFLLPFLGIVLTIIAWWFVNDNSSPHSTIPQHSILTQQPVAKTISKKIIPLTDISPIASKSRSEKHLRIAQGSRNKTPLQNPIPLPSNLSDQTVLFRQRFESALSTLETKGIFEKDLPISLQNKITHLKEQLEQNIGPQIQQPLVAIEQVLLSQTIDRSLVNRKLKRIDLLLQKNSGHQKRLLQNLAGIALQEFMDGQYASANKRLNEILATLGKQESKKQTND